MTNTQLLHILNQALTDWSKILKTGKLTKLTGSGLCSYLYKRYRLDMEFCYTYLYPFRPKFKGLNQFWFTLDKDGAKERVNTINRMITHYTNNPISDDERFTIILLADSN